VGGELIARRAIRALRAVTPHVVLVANDPEAFQVLQLETRPDIKPGLGALGGIHTAVGWAEELGHSGALVAACDMPFLSAGLLQRLLNEAAPAVVVAPASESRRGLEPLCAFYGTACRRKIEAALDRGDRHVTSFFAEVEVRKVPLPEVEAFGDPELLFFNVNTPEERQRAEEAARRLDRS